jgi:hypothetical protein
MKFILLVCAFIALAIADISLAMNINFAPWHPPTRGAARSPCPALSMLPIQENKSHKLTIVQTPWLTTASCLEMDATSQFQCW